MHPAHSPSPSISRVERKRRQHASSPQPVRFLPLPPLLRPLEVEVKATIQRRPNLPLARSRMLPSPSRVPVPMPMKADLLLLQKRPRRVVPKAFSVGSRVRLVGERSRQNREQLGLGSDTQYMHRLHLNSAPSIIVPAFFFATLSLILVSFVADD